GSHSFDQTGSVASTHSERLQACAMRTPVLKLVASSSHRSASRNASTTFWRSTSRTLGSPSAATACRATFFARSQFTGPPCQDIRAANCRNASANCWRSPSAPNALPPPPALSPGGPPAAPDPGPEDPEPEEPDPGRPPPGGRKPKGRSGIAVASQAGWKDHTSHVISGAAHLEHRTGPGSPGADRAGRGRHRGRARAGARADGPPGGLGAGKQG